MYMIPHTLYSIVPVVDRHSETVVLHLQDKITPASGGRQTALAVLIIASILVLLPMLPSGTDAAAVTTGTFL